MRNKNLWYETSGQDGAIGKHGYLSDAEFKTLVIRMLKELSEDLSNIKKIQSEGKDTLIEIKNNLQGNNSTVDEAKNQINDIQHKEAKNNKDKKNPKKMRIVYTAIFKRFNIHIIGIQKKKEQATNKTYLKN